MHVKFNYVTLKVDILLLECCNKKKNKKNIYIYIYIYIYGLASYVCHK